MGSSLLVDITSISPGTCPVSWGTIPSLSATSITVAGTNSVCLIVAQVKIKDASDNSYEMRLKVNGSVTGSPVLTGDSDGVHGSSGNNGGTIIWAVDGLSGSSNSFSVEWQRVLGTSTIDIAYQHTLQVIEIDGGDASIKVDQSSTASGTSTASWANLFSATTISVTSGAIVLMIANVPHSLPLAGDQCAEFRFSVDGTREGAFGAFRKDIANMANGMSMMHVLDGISGNHNFELQWITRLSSGHSPVDTTRLRTFQVVEITANAILQVKQLLTTSGTAPATYGTMTGMTGTYTPAASDSINLVVAQYLAAATVTSNEGEAATRINIAGTQVGSELVDFQDNADELGHICQIWADTGLSASTTFKWDWVDLGNNEVPSLDTGRTRSFFVIEFTQAAGDIEAETSRQVTRIVQRAVRDSRQITRTVITQVSDRASRQVTRTVQRIERDSRQILRTVIRTQQASRQITRIIQRAVRDSRQISRIVLRIERDSRQINREVVFTDQASRQITRTVQRAVRDSRQVTRSVIVFDRDSRQITRIVQRAEKDSRQISREVIFTNQASRQITRIVQRAVRDSRQITRLVQRIERDSKQISREVKIFARASRQVTRIVRVIARDSVQVTRLVQLEGIDSRQITRTVVRTARDSRQITRTVTVQTFDRDSRQITRAVQIFARDSKQVTRTVQREIITSRTVTRLVQLTNRDSVSISVTTQIATKASTSIVRIIQVKSPASQQISRVVQITVKDSRSISRDVAVRVSVTISRTVFALLHTEKTTKLSDTLILVENEIILASDAKVVNYLHEWSDLNAKFEKLTGIEKKFIKINAVDNIFKRIVAEES